MMWVYRPTFFLAQVLVEYVQGPVAAGYGVRVFQLKVVLVSSVASPIHA